MANWLFGLGLVVWDSRGAPGKQSNFNKVIPGNQTQTTNQPLDGSQEIPTKQNQTHCNLSVRQASIAVPFSPNPDSGPSGTINTSRASIHSQTFLCRDNMDNNGAMVK